MAVICIYLARYYAYVIIKKTALICILRIKSEAGDAIVAVTSFAYGMQRMPMSQSMQMYGVL